MSQKQYEVIEFKSENGDVINVEVVAEQQGAFLPAGGTAQDNKKAKVSFEKAIGLVTPVANGVVKAIDGILRKPSEFEVKFYVALSSEFNIKLVTLTSDANLEVKLSWNGENK